MYGADFKLPRMIMEAVALVVMASWFGPVPWTYVFTQDVMVPWEYGLLVWLVILEVCFYSGRNGPLGYLTSWAPVVLYLGRGDGPLVT